MRVETADLQPDQTPRRWDGHVEDYEAAFEPLTNRFAAAALDALGAGDGRRLIDVGAGTGGAALLAAARGWRATPLDASPRMAARAGERSGRGLAVAGDAAALPFRDGAFDAALSVFGIVLCADAAGALREAARVTAPGGPIALVTWTEPERYELAARLGAAAAAEGRPAAAGARLPAQLRFAVGRDFSGLFGAAGLGAPRIERLESRLEAPSAAWLGERLGFAPGLAAMLAGHGSARTRVVERFVRDLEADQGRGPVALAAAAFLGIAQR